MNPTSSKIYDFDDSDIEISYAPLLLPHGSRPVRQYRAGRRANAKHCRPDPERLERPQRRRPHLVSGAAGTQHTDPGSASSDPPVFNLGFELQL